MIYTNMLFALALDKLIFGQSPGLWSLAGSGLILGSAVFVAIQKQQGGTGGRSGERDEEAGGEEEMAMLGGERGFTEEEGGVDEHEAEERDGVEAGVGLSDFPPRGPA